MIKTLLAGSIGVLALIALAPAAHAGYCLTDTDNTSYVLVSQTFIAPAKGACKAWVGFTAQNGHNSPSTGTACKSKDGSHLNFTITTTFPESGESFIETDSISLTLPSLTGSSQSLSFSNGSADYFVIGFQAGVCSPPVTVPAVSGAVQLGGRPVN
jgi:hypothetical protein